MAQPVTISILLVSIACLAAAYNDVRRRRIPNWLTGALAAAAIAIHALGGLHSLLVTLLVMAAVTVLGTLIYSRGIMGGGDIKLAIGACGALGYPLCVPFLLYTMLGGGVLAIAYVILRSNPKQAFSRFVLLASGGAQAIVPDKTQALPYAIAFSIGAAAVALSQTIAPFLRISL